MALVSSSVASLEFSCSWSDFSAGLRRPMSPSRTSRTSRALSSSEHTRAPITAGMSWWRINVLLNCMVYHLPPRPARLSGRFQVNFRESRRNFRWRPGIFGRQTNQNVAAIYEQLLEWYVCTTCMFVSNADECCIGRLRVEFMLRINCSQ